jgi:hypothetical protein
LIDRETRKEEISQQRRKEQSDQQIENSDQAITIFGRNEGRFTDGSCNGCIDLLSDLLCSNNSRPLFSLEAMVSCTLGRLSMVG